MPNPLVPSQEAREAACAYLPPFSSAPAHERAYEAFARFEQAIRKDEAEQCARVAETYWVEADYNTVGIADADMAMELCRQSAAALRARHAGESPDGR